MLRRQPRAISNNVWLLRSLSSSRITLRVGSASALKTSDVEQEFERLRELGVEFTQEPTSMGPVVTAVFDDTCGNLIQIAQRR